MRREHKVEARAALTAVAFAVGVVVGAVVRLAIE
jgi:hypothetical protein